MRDIIGYETKRFYKTIPLIRGMKQTTKPKGLEDIIMFVGDYSKAEEHMILKKIGEKLI